MDKLTFRDGIDLICLAIKLLFSSTQQAENDAEDSQIDDKENNTAKREYLQENYARKLSEKLLSKLKPELPFDMPDNYRSDVLSRELKVRILIDIIVSVKNIILFGCLPFFCLLIRKRWGGCPVMSSQLQEVVIGYLQLGAYTLRASTVYKNRWKMLQG